MPKGTKRSFDGKAAPTVGGKTMSIASKESGRSGEVTQEKVTKAPKISETIPEHRVSKS